MHKMENGEWRLIIGLRNRGSNMDSKLQVRNHTWLGWFKPKDYGDDWELTTHTGEYH